MSKADWGAKRLCQSCGARFYDLSRDPITCPKCGAVYVPEAETRGKKRPPAAEKKKRPAAPPPDAVVPEDEAALPADEAAEEEGEELIEDAAELGEDEDFAEKVEPEEP